MVYAGIVDPLGPLFNPALSVSRIIAHEGYNSITRMNDIALMRLTKPLGFTGAYRHFYTHMKDIYKATHFVCDQISE